MKNMLLKPVAEVMKAGEPMMTQLHLSDVSKIFALRLEAGKIKDCGCGTLPEVFFHVVEGSGTIFMNDEPFAAKAGELVLCPSGKSHRLAADQGEAFGLIVVKPLKQ
jgi:gentisate 1,2-dioxygenase